MRAPARGFTITELVVVLVLLGILGALAGPRLLGTGYDEQALQQQTAAALRYAQSSALAKQRTVCVAFTATTVTLTYASAYGGACDTNLPSPSGASPMQVTAQRAATFNPVPGNFAYDRVGRPTSSQTIQVNNGGQVVVEPETGYVR